MGRTLSNNLFHSSSSSGEDTCRKRSGGQSPECYFRISETRRDNSGRDRGFPSLLPSTPCCVVEFPVTVKGMFRPHYVPWSEQQRIESLAPAYLCNAIRIVTET